MHKNVSKKNCPVIENVYFWFTNAAKKRPFLTSLLLLITGGFQSSGYGCAEKTLFREGGTCTETLEQIEINQQVKSLPQPLHVANRVARHSMLRPYIWRPNHDIVMYCPFIWNQLRNNCRMQKLLRNHPETCLPLICWQNTAKIELLNQK